MGEMVIKQVQTFRRICSIFGECCGPMGVVKQVSSFCAQSILLVERQVLRWLELGGHTKH